MSEGQKGGEFFTPSSLVKLIVEVIEPFRGRIFAPASGSGGMFVQSAEFVERHQGKPVEELSIYGQEKTAETVRLATMILAVHDLSGDIREGNSYYYDLHESLGKFDFVMAKFASDARSSESEIRKLVLRTPVVEDIVVHRATASARFSGDLLGGVVFKGEEISIGEGGITVGIVANGKSTWQCWIVSCAKAGSLLLT